MCFRLVYDRDTGKPKGYGFCEFAGTTPCLQSDHKASISHAIHPVPRLSRLNITANSTLNLTNMAVAPLTTCVDHDTALSAVRNLHMQEAGGRPLRIDLADSDPFLEGKTTVRGELVDGGETRGQWRERKHEGHRADPHVFLRQLPRGAPLPSGTNAMDHIRSILATTRPHHILEILAQMKAREREMCMYVKSDVTCRRSSSRTQNTPASCSWRTHNWATRSSRPCFCTRSSTPPPWSACSPRRPAPHPQWCTSHLRPLCRLYRTACRRYTSRRPHTTPCRCRCHPRQVRRTTRRRLCLRRRTLPRCRCRRPPLRRTATARHLQARLCHHPRRRHLRLSPLISRCLILLPG